MRSYYVWSTLILGLLIVSCGPPQKVTNQELDPIENTKEDKPDSVAVDKPKVGASESTEGVCLPSTQSVCGPFGNAELNACRLQEKDFCERNSWPRGWYESLSSQTPEETDRTPTVPNPLPNPTIAPSLSTQTNSDAAFSKVIVHILKVEGGCSDHPNDPGGRTFKGITTQRARLNGFKGDVCKMPNAQVVSIYKADYWPRPSKYSWPLSLAVMNTEVNSGGGKAQEFLGKLPKGDLTYQAKWFVDQQTAYYKRLAVKISFKVFLQGWLNRSNYMKSIINGEIRILAEEIEFSSAKAF